MKPSPHEQFEDLLGRVIDGDATPAEFAVFQDCLRQDDALRDRYLDEARLNALLRLARRNRRAITALVRAKWRIRLLKAAPFVAAAAALVLFLAAGVTLHHDKPARRQANYAAAAAQAPAENRQAHETAAEDQWRQPKTAAQTVPAATLAENKPSTAKHTFQQQAEQKEMTMKTTTSKTSMGAAAAALAISAANAITALTAGATDYTWLANPLSAKWDTATQNWNAGTWANSFANKAVFGASSVRDITLDGEMSAGGVTVSDADYTFTGGQLILNGSFTVGSNDSAEVSSGLSQTSADTASRFNKAGAGTLTLHGQAGKTNTVYRFNQEAGDLVLDGGTFTVNGTGWSSPENPASFAHLGGNNMILTGGAVFSMTNTGYISKQGEYLTITNGTFSAPNAELLNGFYRGDGLTVAGKGTLDVAKLRISQYADPSAATQTIINLNQGGTIRTGAIRIDEGFGTPYGTVNFNGGQVVCVSPTDDLPFFCGSVNLVDKWANCHLYIKKGGFYVSNPGKRVFMNNPLESGDSPDGGLHFSGSNVIYLRNTNTYNGGTYISGYCLAVYGDRSFGAVPQEPTNNVFFSGDPTLHGAISCEIGTNRLFYISSNCIAKIGTQTGYTMKIHGTFSGEGDPATNNITLRIPSDWNGKTVLDPGEGRTNALGRLQVMGNMEIASGTTTLKCNPRGDAIYTNALMLVWGWGRKFELTGGTLTFAENPYLGYIEVGSDAQFVISGGLADFRNQEFLNGLQGPGTTTIRDTGVLDCNIFRISQCNQTPEDTVLNLCTGGVLRVGYFYIDEGSTQKGEVNFNGGTVVAKPAKYRDGAVHMSLLGNGSAKWSTNIFCYVREGGAIFDTNGNDKWIRNALFTGAEHDGGLVKKGASTLVLANTNTYNGITTVMAGCISFRAPVNTLPPTNTLAIYPGAWCDLHIDPAIGTQTLARVEGSGSFFYCDNLTITDSIAPGIGTNGVGTLTLGNACTLRGTLEIDGNETASDCLTVSSGVQDISGLSVKLNDLKTLNKKKVYTIFSAPGGFTGKFASTSLGQGSSWILRYDASGKKINLVYNAGTVVMLM